MGLSQEQIQYKNDLILSKNQLVLKLPRFFTHIGSGWKSGNFKASLFFDEMKSLFYCLSFNQISRAITSNFPLKFIHSIHKWLVIKIVCSPNVLFCKDWTYRQIKKIFRKPQVTLKSVSKVEAKNMYVWITSACSFECSLDNRFLRFSLSWFEIEHLKFSFAWQVQLTDFLLFDASYPKKEV